MVIREGLKIPWGFNSPCGFDSHPRHMEPVCFLNGKIVPLREALVNVYDLGLLRGFGVYEGITAFKGSPFHFHDHWERLENSAKALGLKVPVSEERALEATKKVIAHNAPGKRATIRILLTGGSAEGGIVYVPGRETFYILGEVAEQLPASIYENGGSLVTTEHERSMPEYKTINYITAVTLQPKRIQAKAVDILYVSKGEVLECAGSNIFIVRNGGIATPKHRILPGITRKVTFELARGTYPIDERRISLNELFVADEVFMTGSFKDIVPIVTVNDAKIGDGTVGPITRDLMDRFAKELETV